MVLFCNTVFRNLYIVQVHNPPTIFTTSYKVSLHKTLSKGKPGYDHDVIEVKKLFHAVALLSFKNNKQIYLPDLIVQESRSQF